MSSTKNFKQKIRQLMEDFPTRQKAREEDRRQFRESARREEIRQEHEQRARGERA